MTKIVLVAIGLVMLAVITGLIAYAVFEAMTRVAEERTKPPESPEKRVISKPSAAEKSHKILK